MGNRVFLTIFIKIIVMHLHKDITMNQFVEFNHQLDTRTKGQTCAHIGNQARYIATNDIEHGSQEQYIT